MALKAIASIAIFTSDDNYQSTPLEARKALKEQVRTNMNRRKRCGRNRDPPAETITDLPSAVTSFRAQHPAQFAQAYGDSSPTTPPGWFQEVAYLAFDGSWQCRGYAGTCFHQPQPLHNQAMQMMMMMQRMVMGGVGMAGLQGADASGGLQNLQFLDADNQQMGRPRGVRSRMASHSAIADAGGALAHALQQPQRRPTIHFDDIPAVQTPTSTHSASPTAPAYPAILAAPIEEAAPAAQKAAIPAVQAAPIATEPAAPAVDQAAEAAAADWAAAAATSVLSSIDNRRITAKQQTKEQREEAAQQKREEKAAMKKKVPWGAAIIIMHSAMF